MWRNEPSLMLQNHLMLFFWTFCKAVHEPYWPSKTKHLWDPHWRSLCAKAIFCALTHPTILTLLLSSSLFLYSSIKLSLKGITLHHSHLSLKYHVLIGEYNTSSRHRINNSFFKLAGVIRMCFSEPLHFHIHSSYSVTVQQKEKFCANLDRGNTVTESPCHVLHSFGMLWRFETHPRFIRFNRWRTGLITAHLVFKSDNECF